MSDKTNVASKAPADALKGHRKITLREFLLNYNAIIILVVLIVAASLISDIFLTKTNIMTLLRQQTVYLIIAMGMLMVIITAGIDLAAAPTATLSTIILGCFLTRWDIGLHESTGGVLLIVLIAIASSALIGAINGFLIAKMRMPAFIVTLAMSYAAEGVCYIITKGNTIMLDTSSVAYKMLVYPGFSFMTVGGFPVMAIVALVIVVIFFFLMRYTTYGRMVYAIGSNENAVQLAGINSKKYLFVVYLLHGILCGIAGVFMVARSGNASALSCSGDYSLSTVAAVVIGGASLAGGEGTVPMTVVGVFVIAIIGNIMNLINLPQYPQMVVKAAVIILAVLLKSLSTKKQG